MAVRVNISQWNRYYTMAFTEDWLPVITSHLEMGD